MGSPTKLMLFRYFVRRTAHAIYPFAKRFESGQISGEQFVALSMKNLLNVNLTFLFHERLEMTPTARGRTLLVRKLADLEIEPAYVGDLVLLKDPYGSRRNLLRRLAAVGGSEMVSSDGKDDSFVLQEDHCWVLADDDKLKPQEAYDSRTFGPVSMTDIVGRAIYCVRTAADHGPVQNSCQSMKEDSPVLAVELSVAELVSYHKRYYS